MTDTKFTLEIHLGNATMRTPLDLASRLHRIAEKIAGDELESSVLDLNGNTVGRWSVTYPQTDHATAATTGWEQACAEAQERMERAYMAADAALREARMRGAESLLFALAADIEMGNSFTAIEVSIESVYDDEGGYFPSVSARVEWPDPDEEAAHQAGEPSTEDHQEDLRELVESYEVDVCRALFATDHDYGSARLERAEIQRRAIETLGRIQHRAQARPDQEDNR